MLFRLGGGAGKEVTFEWKGEIRRNLGLWDSASVYVILGESPPTFVGLTSSKTDLG